MKEDLAKANVPSGRRAVIEAVIASTVGTTIEWYDFFLYGVMAALVFPRLFFPEGRSASSAKFSPSAPTRSVSWPVRWAGSSSATWAIVLVANRRWWPRCSSWDSARFASASCRRPHEIGLAAPILLTSLRFVQGIGVGGEWGGAVLLALEYGHRGKRGFFASWPQAGVPLGLLTSAGVVALFEELLSPDDFLAWGWRVPFLLSGLLIVVGLLIRVRILETPLFRQLQADESGRPRSRHGDATAPLARSAAGRGVAHQREFLLLPVQHLHPRLRQGHPARRARPGPAGGQRGGGRRVLHHPALGHPVRLLVAQGDISAGQPLPHRLRRALLLVARYPPSGGDRDRGGRVSGDRSCDALQRAGVADPGTIRYTVRYTGASLGYQLAAPLAGGTAPLIAAWLAFTFPDRFWPLAVYIMAICVLSLCCVYFLAETSRKDLASPSD